MLYIEEHGGGCCGRRHLFEFDYSFPNESEYDTVRELLGGYEYSSFDDDEENDPSIQVSDLCVEVTLIHEQAFTKPYKSMFGSLKDWDNPKFINKTWARS